MKAICTFLLLFFVLSVNAQTLVRVVDKTTSEPIPFATVSFESIGKKEKKAGVTNDKGELQIAINQITIVSASSLGFETKTDTIAPNVEHTIFLSPSNQQIDEVVVTASAHAQTRDKSIYKIDVISNVQIKERAANNVADLLATQSSLRVEQNGILGSSVRMQGLSGEQVKVLIDGVPVVGRVNGNINLNQLNLQNVDHIEIIEGPMSVIYGSDAMGGVINIITKENTKRAFDASVNLYYETIGKYNGNFSTSFHHKKHTFNLTGSRNFFQGAALPEDPLRVKTWKPSLQYNFDANYIYTSDYFKLKYTSSYFDETYVILDIPRKEGDPQQTDSTLIYHAFANDAYNYTSRFVNKLDYMLKLDKNAVNIVASYSNYSREMVTYKNDLSLLQRTTDGVANQDTQKIRSLMVRGMWSNTYFEKLDISGGPDFSFDHAIDEADFGTKNMTDLAVFLNLKYSPIPNFSIQPGIRFIYNSLFTAPIVYSVNVKFNPDDRWAVRMSYAKGFRSPSLKELYFKFTALDHLVYGNPDLKAEFSNNANAAINYTIPFQRGSFGINLASFYNQIKNKIDYMEDPSNPLEGHLTNLPIDLYKNFGGTLSFKFQLFQLFTSETGIGLTAISKLQDNKTFSYSRDYTESLYYQNQRFGFNVSVNYKYFGSFTKYTFKQMNDGTSSISNESLAGSYHSMEAQVTKHLFNNKIDIGFGVKNIFDNTRVSATGTSTTSGSAGLVGYGRTYFVKLTYSLN